MNFKKTLLMIVLAYMAFTSKAQPGKYAGKHLSLINTVYRDSKTIPGLSGWSFVEASVLSAMSDSITITVDVFKKGTTFIAFFSTLEDSSLNEFKIADVLEIPAVTKGWAVKTSFCQLNNFDNPWIVAHVKVTPTEYLKSIKKAWQFNRTTKQIETMPPDGIGCLNDAFDMH